MIRKLTKNIILNKMTSRTRYSQLEMSRVEEGEDEPFTTPEEEEDDEDIRPEDLTYTEMIWMMCRHPIQYKLLWDRAGQEVRVEILDKQYEILQDFVTKEEQALDKEREHLEQRLQMVRNLYNQKLAELDPAVIQSMTTQKARLHVQSMMKAKDQIELNQIDNKAFEVKRRSIGLDLVITKMNYLDKQRTDSRSVLHDMRAVGVMDRANVLGKNVHHIDIKTYRDEMEKNVNKLMDQMREMSLVSERVADVDAIKQEAAELAKVDKETALDVLFKDVKTKVAVKTKVSTQQQQTKVRQVEYA